MIIPIILLVGGTWIIQDSLASILFYYGKENWHYSQSLRILRGLVGLVILVCGILLVK